MIGSATISRKGGDERAHRGGMAHGARTRPLMFGNGPRISHLAVLASAAELRRCRRSRPPVQIPLLRTVSDGPRCRSQS